MIMEREELPSGWIQHMDTVRHIPYYVNLNTEPPSVSFTHPSLFVVQDQQVDRPQDPQAYPSQAGSSSSTQLYNPQPPRPPSDVANTPFALIAQAQTARKQSHAQRLYANALATSPNGQKASGKAPVPVDAPGPSTSVSPPPVQGASRSLSVASTRSSRPLPVPPPPPVEPLTRPAIATVNSYAVNSYENGKTDHHDMGSYAEQSTSTLIGPQTFVPPPPSIESYSRGEMKDPHQAYFPMQSPCDDFPPPVPPNPEKAWRQYSTSLSQQLGKLQSQSLIAPAQAPTQAPTQPTYSEEYSVSSHHAKSTSPNPSGSEVNFPPSTSPALSALSLPFSQPSSFFPQDELDGSSSGPNSSSSTPAPTQLGKARTKRKPMGAPFAPVQIYSIAQALGERQEGPEFDPTSLYIPEALTSSNSAHAAPANTSPVANEELPSYAAIVHEKVPVQEKRRQLRPSDPAPYSNELSRSVTQSKPLMVTNHTHTDSQSSPIQEDVPSNPPHHGYTGSNKLRKERPGGKALERYGAVPHPVAPQLTTVTPRGNGGSVNPVQHVPRPPPTSQANRVSVYSTQQPPNPPPQGRFGQASISQTPPVGMGLATTPIRQPSAYPPTSEAATTRNEVPSAPRYQTQNLPPRAEPLAPPSTGFPHQAPTVQTMTHARGNPPLPHQAAHRSEPSMTWRNTRPPQPQASHVNIPNTASSPNERRRSSTHPMHTRYAGDYAMLAQMRAFSKQMQK